MMTELILVEGVSDVQLISYYLQNVYGWKYQRENILGIEPLDEHEHIESLSKNGNQMRRLKIKLMILLSRYLWRVSAGKRILLRTHLDRRRAYIHIF